MWNGKFNQGFTDLFAVVGSCFLIMRPDTSRLWLYEAVVYALCYHSFTIHQVRSERCSYPPVATHSYHPFMIVLAIVHRNLPNNTL